MKPNSIKATLATIKDNYYSRMHRQMEEADDLYHQRLERFLPKTDYEIKVHKTSTARNIVDGFKNQLRTDEPSVHYQMASHSKKADAQRTKNEQWGRAMLREERSHATIDPSLQNGFDALLRGASCKKVIVDVDKLIGPRPKRKGKLRDEWDERARVNWPFKSIALDPKTVFVNPGNERPHRWAIEEQTKTVSDMDGYVANGKWKDFSGENNPAKPIKRLEYWSAPTYNENGDKVDPGWLVVEVEGIVVEEKENPYGFVPYIFDYSGMGRVDADSNPEHLAVGVLTGIAGELAKEVETLTAISAMASSHAFPTILTPEDARQTARKFQGGGAGKIIKYDPLLGPPAYMSPPPPNDNFFLYLERIEGNIRRVSAPALQGVREPGVNFGIMQAQLTAQQLAYIRPVKSMLNRMGSQTLDMMAKLVIKFDIDMTVDGSLEDGVDVTISPSDFEHGSWEVEFEVVDPSENDRALLVGEALRRAGDLSQRTFWEIYAKHIVVDPDEEEARLGSEKLFNLWLQSGSWLQTVIQEDSEETQAVQAEGQAAQLEGQISQGMAEESGQRAQNIEAAAASPGLVAGGMEAAQEGLTQALGGF